MASPVPSADRLCSVQRPSLLDANTMLLPSRLQIGYPSKPASLVTRVKVPRAISATQTSASSPSPICAATLALIGRQRQVDVVARRDLECLELAAVATDEGEGPLGSLHRSRNIRQGAIVGDRKLNIPTDLDAHTLDDGHRGANSLEPIGR